MAEIHPSSTLRISDEKTMQLIELYQREECLWNTKTKDYRNKTMRYEAVHRIAQELDIPNFDTRHVTMKFKNLRNSYSQELKKIANSKATGDGSYVPSVFWFETMNSFIRPHLQTARGTPYSKSLVLLVDGTEEWVHLNNPDDPAEQSGSDTEPIDTNQTKKRSESQLKKRKAKNGHILRSKLISSSKRAKTESDSDDQSTSRSSKKESSSELDQKSIASSLTDVAANLHVLLSRKDDYFDSFGKYIAGLLRSLPYRQALEVQPQIISLITAAEIASHSHVALEDQDDRHRNAQVTVKVERNETETIEDCGN